MSIIELVDPPSFKLLLVEGHAETWSHRTLRFRRPELQRLRQQVGLVIQRADKVAGIGLTINRRQRGGDVQHGRGTNTQFQIAANRAHDTSGFRNIRDEFAEDATE